MANPNFSPTFSTNEVYRDLNDNRCLTDDLDAIESDVAAIEIAIDAVENTVEGKADSIHQHTGYAETSHTHVYANNVLWQGGLQMNAEQTVTLSESISEQRNGVVLVWSEYNVTEQAASNQGFVTHFIPKALVELQPNTFHSFPFIYWFDPTIQCAKGLYIGSNSIVGHASNVNSSDTSAFVNSYALRYVIGV